MPWPTRDRQFQNQDLAPRLRLLRPTFGTVSRAWLQYCTKHTSTLLPGVVAKNMLEILVGQPEFLEAKKVFDSQRKHFEHYVAARNSFEHFGDRLPGRTEEKRVREVRDDPTAGARRVYSGISDGQYTHSDQVWDITPGSLDLLERLIADVLAIVHRTIDEQIGAKSTSA